MYTYEILTKDEKDTLETKVKKSGLTAEFTLKQVYDHKALVEKDIKERAAKVELCVATMKNIEINHPDVAEIIKSIKKGKKKGTGIFATLFLWIQQDMERDNQKRMIKEREEVINEYETELEVIHRTLDIPEPVKISYNKAEKND
jgi:hypothetical protein